MRISFSGYRRFDLKVEKVKRESLVNFLGAVKDQSVIDLFGPSLPPNAFQTGLFVTYLPKQRPDELWIFWNDADGQHATEINQAKAAGTQYAYLESLA